ncbi:MAG: hypothetical protein A2551_01460 [Elusimicrobia bacterium RIFOXYD2_FULL_34_30]|nr:MAG: hypothetical protein A2551_01460 [Elusimicrobia bacterium RIFOXYD2_FULL_34_30]
MSRIIDVFVDFFFPNICVICGKNTNNTKSSVCHTCIQKIDYIKTSHCVTCYQPLPDGGAHCWQCKRTKYHFEIIIAVGKYSGILRELILKFKEKDFLKENLGEILLNALKSNLNIDKIDYIVPVPLSKKREFYRGYNQAMLLAEYISGKTGKNIIVNNLIRVKNTKAQYELNREERLLNLKDVFELKEPWFFKNKSIVIIDDIATTCSTLEECSRVLKKSGAKNVYGLVLARD